MYYRLLETEYPAGVTNLPVLYYGLYDLVILRANALRPLFNGNCRDTARSLVSKSHLHTATHHDNYQSSLTISVI